MTHQEHKKNAQVILALARKLAAQPGLTWIDANNAIYSPTGPFVRLFPTRADRQAFAKLDESRQIDGLIDSLPEPPLKPTPKEYSGKFNVRIPKSLHAELASEAAAEGVSLNQLVLAKLAVKVANSSIAIDTAPQSRQLRVVAAVIDRGAWLRERLRDANMPNEYTLRKANLCRLALIVGAGLITLALCCGLGAFGLYQQQSQDSPAVTIECNLPQSPDHLAVSSDGAFALVSCVGSEDEATTQLWSLNDKTKLHEFKATFGPFAFLPNNEFIAFTHPKYMSNAFAIFDQTTGAKRQEFRLDDENLPARPSDLSVSPHGNVLTWLPSKIVRWNSQAKSLAAWETLFDISAISPYFDNGARLVIADSRGEVAICDAGTGRQIRLLAKGQSPSWHITRIAITSDGSTIAAATVNGSSGDIRVWNGADGKIVLEENFVLGPFSDVQMSADGQTILYGNPDKAISVVDVKTGKTRFVLKGHTLPVRRLALTGDNRRLVSIGEDNTIRVWNLTELKGWK